MAANQSGKSGKANLSKHLLQMKFMQRSALQVQKEQYKQENFIDDDHWRRDMPKAEEKQSKFLLEPSFLYCEELRFGRISHKGFSPEIEKLMRNENKELELTKAEEREKEMSIDDQEMAARYSSLVGTIAKKFTKRRYQKQVDSEEDEEEDISPSVKKNRYSKRNDGIYTEKTQHQVMKQSR